MAERLRLMRNRGSVVIVENDKVGLILRIRDGIVYYVFPGGGIEKGETPEEASKREAFEELGVEVKVNECLTKIEDNGTQYFFYPKSLRGHSELDKVRNTQTKREREEYIYLCG